MIQRETSAAEARSATDVPKGPVRTCVGCRKR
ncbi:MAG: YlxR family protein, partial [Mycobacterium sp.]